MDRATVEGISNDITKHLMRARQCKDCGDNVKMRAEAETAAALFRQVLDEAGDPFRTIDDIRTALASFGYTEGESRTLLASTKGKKKRDIKGRSSGGSEHKKGQRPSTKGQHQKSRATKRRSYGGEKADDGRRYPRKRPSDWSGQWPPPTETEERPLLGGEDEPRTTDESEGRSMLGITTLPSDAKHKNRTHNEEATMTVGQQKYEQALRLAREADRTGGPLPVTLLQEAADTGYPPAVYALANWHLHGKGVKKDYKKAVSLLTKAANERFAPAEYDLAVSYERGKGVQKSEKKAWLYYLHAANDGDAQAQTEVARCFYHGLGTKKDFAKAVAWYRKAAIRGDSDAQYALGVAYEHGEGVEKDIHTAMRWYRKAAAQGDKEAEKANDELEEFAN